MNPTSTFSLSFILLVVIVSGWLVHTLRLPRKGTMLLVAWLALVSTLSLSGWLNNSTSLPPRLLLVVGPPLAFSAVCAFSDLGLRIAKVASVSGLHALHAARGVVEVGFLVTLEKLGYLSPLLTFHGRNFDLVFGVTAPIVAMIAYWNRDSWRKSLTVWNALGITSLLWVMGHAVLSAPLPFQQLSFEQPTTAMFHFPFALLPGFVAPAMIVAHVLAIRALMLSRV